MSKLAWNIAAPARCSKPVIVANRGYCFGVGFEISLACDFRLVSETCFYALPAAARPFRLGGWRVDVIGISRQGRGDAVEAHHDRQAYDGHRHQIGSDDKLEAATDALVEELRHSPWRDTARTLLDETEAPISKPPSARRPLLYPLRQSDDFREGVEAFHAKRKAVFRGS